jgi:hypothetical protein
VLELPHPAELWGGYCLDDEQYVEAWDAQVWVVWVGGHVGGQRIVTP